MPRLLHRLLLPSLLSGPEDQRTANNLDDRFLTSTITRSVFRTQVDGLPLRYRSVHSVPAQANPTLSLALAIHPRQPRASQLDLTCVLRAHPPPLAFLFLVKLDVETTFIRKSRSGHIPSCQRSAAFVLFPRIHRCPAVGHNSVVPGIILYCCIPFETYRLQAYRNFRCQVDPFPIPHDVRRNRRLCSILSTPSDLIVEQSFIFPGPSPLAVQLQ